MANKIDRLRRNLLAVAGLATMGFGLFRQAKKEAPILLRPPGALGESSFLAACIRCGLCVEACPYDTLKLASLAHGAAYATPYLTAREVPCYLCQQQDELLCTKVCPSGALNPVIPATHDDILDKVDMGAAEINTGTCLAWNDVICRACWHACPFPNEAIVLDIMGRPDVYADMCVGCGLCDHACLAEPSAIVVNPGLRA